MSVEDRYKFSKRMVDHRVPLDRFLAISSTTFSAEYFRAL